MTTYNFTFKTDRGVYKNFTKEIKDGQHFDRYVDLMERKYNYKLIGHEIPSSN